MTTNERFLSVLHRVTSCRHLATVNITIWNGRIEVRHTVFDEMYILRSFPLPNTHNEYCACMAAACRCLSDKNLLIEINHIPWCTLVNLDTSVKKHYLIAVLCYAAQVMAYKQNCLTELLELLKLVITLGLEKYVAYGKCFINNKYLRVNIYCNRKCKSYKHTA